jgi:hypothetical protein
MSLTPATATVRQVAIEQRLAFFRNQPTAIFYDWGMNATLLLIVGSDRSEPERRKSAA